MRTRTALALVAALALAAALPAGAEEVPRYGAAVVYDPQGGRFLREYRADEPLPPASLAKMVTALLVAERLRPDDQVRISRAAANVDVDSIRWPRGTRFTVDDLIHGMMMRSSNGAAIALAEHLAGSTGAFVRLMNARARELGATATRFRNPHGLDARGQRSTARDLALIATAVLRNPWLSQVVARTVHRIPWPDGGGLVMYGGNRLLNRYRGAIGVKPGFTSEAGNSLAAAAMRRGRVMVAIVLDDPVVYTDAARLLDAGFRLAPDGPRWDDPARAPQPAPVTAATPTVPENMLPPVTVIETPLAPQQRGGAGRAILHLVSWTLGYVALSAMARPRRRRQVPRAPVRADPLDEIDEILDEIWPEPVPARDRAPERHAARG